MSAVISVENLSKAYRIGTREEVPDTLVGAAKGILRAPLRNLRNLKRLDTNRHQEEEDTLWALKDVSFEVNEGDVVGIIGRNGAGKSTLLKILSRITEPTSGRAVIGGRVSSLLEVGTGFHPELSGRDNIYMNGTILGMTKREIDSKFDEIVDFSGVERFLDTPTKRYSSGMQVRLAFAVAAHLEPEILIIDEVLAVGDAEFQSRCLGKMREVAGSGRTVLFVSHNLGAIQSLCALAMVMEAGANSPWQSADDAIAMHLSSNHEPDSGLRIAAVHRQGRAIQQVRLLCSGIPTHRIPCGSQVELEIVLGDANVGRFHCGIVISNSNGQRVVVFHTSYHGGISLTNQSGQVVKCNIPHLPLVPGRYRIDVILGDGGTTIDEALACIHFESVFQDLLGTGQLPNERQGYVVLPCFWEAVR
ncbi:ABC transporter ATP-binding protein [Novipirellula artificiosorum]|uniref:Teichoic acids export ATP-binding protein TagH n=1 Tax=Novipirellula artificiosorum TaxID=2528016 RepID=A0A5C6D057_9BACT|nr:ABC transporter ATP-binding protein [Novipirellula artificiosorum]TWU29137.1 Teichoic acids export ATP-binding protein TagH [Novipirellula artificiosorum]